MLEREPDWTALPADRRHPTCRDCCGGASKRIRKRRLRDIGDARIELDDALGTERSPAAATRAQPVHRRWRALAIVAVMVPAGIAAALLLARPTAASFEQLTFRRARIGGARFVSSGAAVVFSEASQGDGLEISRLDFADSPLSRPLNYPVRSEVLAARAGELALSLDRQLRNR